MSWAPQPLATAKGLVAQMSDSGKHQVRLWSAVWTDPGVGRGEADRISLGRTAAREEVALPQDW